MRRLLVFILLAYSISWIIWLPLYFPQLGLPVFAYHHALGGLGPMLAALMMKMSEGREEFVNYIVRFISFRFVGFVAIALLSPFVLGYIAMFADSIISQTVMDFGLYFSNSEFPHFSFVTLLLYNIFFFGFGEEAGWRGFALPILQQRYSALIASVILTGIWAVWHWPLFLYRPGYVSMELGAVMGWVLSLFTGSILMTWFFNSSNGNLLACVVFHSTIDIVFTGNISPATSTILGVLITMWGIITLFVYKPQNLSKKERFKALKI